MTTSTALEPVIERGRVAARKPGATFKDVIEAVAAPAERLTSTEAIPFPKLPRPVSLDQSKKEDIDSAARLYGQVHLDTRRTLTQGEQDLLIAEYDAIQAAAKLLKEREEALKTIAKTHLDVDAEERGIAVRRAVVDQASGEIVVEATPRDSKGHYVLPGELVPDGSTRGIIRYLISGGVDVSQDRLDELHAEGTVTREQYLALTRERRVLDQDKAQASAKADPSLYGVLGLITVRKPGTAGVKPSNIK